MPIEDILAEADDFKLCSNLFSLIVDRHGSTIDVAQVEEPERVVLLTWHTMGIIENGGFRYLFEGNLDGDPDFTLSAAAYEAIGAHQAAEAFRETLAIFPQSPPPRDIKKRLRYYLERCPEWPTPQDHKIFDSSEQIKTCLAAYIREHAGDFRRICSATYSLAPRSEEEDADDEPEDSGPTAFDVLERLPHWERVALAARSARIVFPLLTRFWPDIDGKYPRNVQKAITLAEASVAREKAVDGLRDASLQALITAGAALAAHRDVGEKEPKPRNAFEGTIASQTAKVAEKAAEAAAAGPEKSALLALEAWRFARSAAEDAEEEPMAEALQELLAVAYANALGGDEEGEEEPPLVARGRRLFLTAAIPIGIMDVSNVFYYLLFAEKTSWGSVSFSLFFLVAIAYFWMGETWARWTLGIRCMLGGLVTIAVAVLLMKRFSPVILAVLLTLASINLAAGSIFLLVPSVKAFFRNQRERHRGG